MFCNFHFWQNFNRATPRPLDRFPGDLSDCLHLLIGFDFIEVDHGRRLTAMGSVWAMVVVEGDPASDGSPGLRSGFPCVQVDAFLRQGPPETIDEDVVETALLADLFLSPHLISAIIKDEFIKATWEVVRRKVEKYLLLSDTYATSKASSGLPVVPDSDSIRMFRLMLTKGRSLIRQRNAIEDRAVELLTRWRRIWLGVCCRPGHRGHWLGTDDFGRDIWSRIAYGSRITLYIVTLVAVTAPVLDLLIGTVAGYFGGWVDQVLMRITDIFLAFPRLILALALVAVLGPGIENAILAIALTAWPPYARVTRAETLTVRTSDYIAAVRLQGAGAGRIIWGHVMPMCLPSVIIRVTLDMAGVILIAPGLGFLGLGVQPPTLE